MSLLKTNIDYSGKEVDQILIESFKDTLFYNTFGARILRGFKCKYTYYDLSTEATLQAYEVCPAVFEDLTLNQRTGEMCEFQMPLEMDKNSLVCTLREKYLAEGFNDESPLDDTAFVAAMTEMVLGRIAEQYDDIILNGDTVYGTDYLDLCDGLLAKFEADADVIDVGNTAVTASNVLTELNKIYAAVPAELKSRARQAGRKLKFGVAQNIFDAYLQALTQTGNGFNFYSPDGMLASVAYLGYEIVPLALLPDDTAFATYPDNIALYRDGDGDFASLTIRDLSNSQICDKIQMRVKFRSGVDYGYGKYIVYYS